MRQNLVRTIESVLHSLGLLGASMAMRQMVCAIRVAYEAPYLLSDMMKGLYPAVAAHFEGATTQSVERNLRSLRDRLWVRGDVDLLRKMAGYNLQIKPTTGELIDIIRYYIETENLLTGK